MDSFDVGVLRVKVRCPFVMLAVFGMVFEVHRTFFPLGSGLRLGLRLGVKCNAQLLSSPTLTLTLALALTLAFYPTLTRCLHRTGEASHRRSGILNHFKCLLLAAAPSNYGFATKQQDNVRPLERDD